MKGVFTKNIVFASAEEAREHLRSDGIFLQTLSPFDRSGRLQTSRNVSIEEFIDFISKQGLDWTEQEKVLTNELIDHVKKTLSGYNMLFPDEIILIKTTGLEEGNAAYCRANNIIVFPTEFLNMPKKQLRDLILHELFHIFSRNNIKIQEKLYGILSFVKTNEMQLPIDIFQRKITNPDAPLNNYYFIGKVDGHEHKLMPILLSVSNYDEKREGSRFFEYMQLFFITIKEEENLTVPITNKKEPVLFTLEQVTNFFDLVGNNTGYIIHPEEILAENFVLLINEVQEIKNIEIIEKMKKILKKQ